MESVFARVKENEDFSSLSHDWNSVEAFRLGKLVQCDLVQILGSVSRDLDAHHSIFESELETEIGEEIALFDMVVGQSRIQPLNVETREIRGGADGFQGDEVAGHVVGADEFLELVGSRAIVAHITAFRLEVLLRYRKWWRLSTSAPLNSESLFSDPVGNKANRERTIPLLAESAFSASDFPAKSRGAYQNLISPLRGVNPSRGADR